jgi:hypothetical protein
MMQWKFRCFWHSMLAATFVMTALLASPAYFAADDDEDEDDETVAAAPVEKTWEDEKKEIDEFWKTNVNGYRKETEKKLSEPVVSSIIKKNIQSRRKVQGLGDFAILRRPGIAIDWTNLTKQPTKGLEAIVNDVHKEIRAKALNRFYPLAELESFMPTQDEIDALSRKERSELDEEGKRKMAYRKKILSEMAVDERFVMYEEGTHVSVLLRNGLGPASQIDNKIFYAKDEERLKIGDRIILRDDLSDEEQAHFYKDVNERVQEAYLTATTGRVAGDMESYIDDACYETIPGKFRECGYVPRIDKANASLTTAKPDFWMKKCDFYNKVRTYLINIAVDKFEKEKMPDIMRGAGYIEYPTKDGKGKEWITEAEKIRRETPPAPDPNSMQPGGMPPGAMPPGAMPPGAR